jgi:hypothetical protein
MNDSVFGWDYPPGVTDKDIEKHFGNEPVAVCEGCKEEKKGVEFGFCPKCMELMDSKD